MTRGLYLALHSKRIGCPSDILLSGHDNGQPNVASSKKRTPSTCREEAGIGPRQGIAVGQRVLCERVNAIQTLYPRVRLVFKICGTRESRGSACEEGLPRVYRHTEGLPRSPRRNGRMAKRVVEYGSQGIFYATMDP
eukprot:1175753-Prorocentrum_minimum.AAC.3